MPISMTGTDRLFLGVPLGHGGATGNDLFNLNYAEFNGEGVGVAP